MPPSDQFGAEGFDELERKVVEFTNSNLVNVRDFRLLLFLIQQQGYKRCEQSVWNAVLDWGKGRDALGFENIQGHAIGERVRIALGRVDNCLENPAEVVYNIRELFRAWDNFAHENLDSDNLGRMPEVLDKLTEVVEAIEAREISRTPNKQEHKQVLDLEEDPAELDNLRDLYELVDDQNLQAKLVVENADDISKELRSYYLGIETMCMLVKLQIQQMLVNTNE